MFEGPKLENFLELDSSWLIREPFIGGSPHYSRINNVDYILFKMIHLAQEIWD